MIKNVFKKCIYSIDICSVLFTGSFSDAFTIKNIADKICIINPTNGIQAIHDVTIPKILPTVFPPSLLVRTNVIICNINITANAI